MNQLFGDFQPMDPIGGSESLSLNFSPSSVPLKQRWRNNGLSADFLADYVTTFLPRSADEPGLAVRENEVRGAVSYIANELLENAMKYGVEGSHPISIQLQLTSDRVSFQATNSAPAAMAARFQLFIERLLAADPIELYAEQLENSEDEGSGLGFLTMINDYGASLAWRFTTELPDWVVVTTQAHLRI
jgi:hypothetical protein